MMPIGSSSSTIGRLVMPASQATILPRYARATCRRANVLQLLIDLAESLRHVQRRVVLTRRLDRGEARALGATAALDLPTAIEALQRLGCQGVTSRVSPGGGSRR